MYTPEATGHVRVVRTGWPLVAERHMKRVESDFRRGKGIIEKTLKRVLLGEIGHLGYYI